MTRLAQANEIQKNIFKLLAHPHLAIWRCSSKQFAGPNFCITFPPPPKKNAPIKNHFHEKNCAIFKQIYTLKQLIAFKMAYCCFFSLGEIKIFQISPKKSFLHRLQKRVYPEKKEVFSIFEKRFDLNKRTNDLITCDRMLNSVTRWLDYLSIFVHLQQWRLAE